MGPLQVYLQHVKRCSIRSSKLHIWSSKLPEKALPVTYVCPYHTVSQHFPCPCCALGASQRATIVCTIGKMISIPSKVSSCITYNPVPIARPPISLAISLAGAGDAARHKTLCHTHNTLSYTQPLIMQPLIMQHLIMQHLALLTAAAAGSDDVQHYTWC